MPFIEIGYDLYGNVVNMVEDYGYGVIMVLAKSRYGKTIEAKNIYVQVAKYRNSIFFDYLGEHSESRWGNFRSKDDICFIPDLYTIQDFAFYIIEFDRFLDWRSMGFTDNVIPMLRRLLEKEDTHQNDPVIFLQILRDLPVATADVEEFREKYPDYDSVDAQNYSAKQSMISKFEAMWDSRIIIPPVGSDNHAKYSPDKIHIDDWPELVRDHPHLNINLKLTSSDSEAIARISVGKILEKLYPALSELRPFIVVEEADKICPNTGDTDEFDVSSQRWLRDYCIKHQRKGVKIMFVTQEPESLDKGVIKAGKTWIFGIHTPTPGTHSVLDDPGFDYERDVIKKLRHDVDKGHRDFGFIETGRSGKYKIFAPKDSSTRVPKKFKLRSNFLAADRRQGTGILKKLMFKEIK